MNIIVIEDDPSIIALVDAIFQTLQSDGLEFTYTIVTENFDRMLEPLEWTGVDAVIADWALRGARCNGCDILYVAQRAHVTRRVLYTAFAGLATYDHCPFADAVLSKSTPDALERQVRVWVEDASSE